MATLKTPADVKNHIEKVIKPTIDGAMSIYADVKNKIPGEIAKLDKAIAEEDADQAQLSADAMDRRYLKNAEEALANFEFAQDAISEITKSRVDYSQEEATLDAQLARMKKPKIDLQLWLKTGSKLVSDAAKLGKSTAAQQKAAFNAWTLLVENLRQSEKRYTDRQNTARAYVALVDEALKRGDSKALAKVQAAAAPLVKPMPKPFDELVKYKLGIFAQKFDSDLVKRGPNARQVERDEKEITDLTRSGESARLKANDMLRDVMAAKI